MLRRTVLCVDDEPDILKAIKRILRKEPYKIITASNAREGLEIVNSEPIDLVISDQRMPEVTGIEFLQQVKKVNENIVRVILSGYADLEAVISAINHGEVYRFFTKPWNDDELKSAIRQCLEHYELKIKNIELTTELSKERHELKTIINSMGEILLVCGTNLVITRANPIAYSYCNLNLDHECKLSDILKPEDDLQNLINSANHGKSPTTKLLLLDTQGNDIPVTITMNVLDDPASDNKQYVVCMQDYSQMQVQLDKTELLRKQLHHSQKMDAIGKLAGGIAHEYNNLLCAIVGYVEVLKEKYADDEMTTSALDIIYNAAMHGSELTKNILTFARKEKDNFSCIDVNISIKEGINILQNSLPKDIWVALNLPEDGLYVYANASQLIQVILNLCINAKDAMPTGGKIEISVDTIEVTSENYELYPALCAGNYIRITVADEGSGMSDDIKQRVFEPFFTTKEVGKGTGLGLSTVSGIVDAIKGHVCVESEINKGTTFTVLLPQLEATTPAEGQVAIKNISNIEKYLTNKGFLIIDDEEALRELSKHIIPAPVSQIFLAKNGKYGVDTFAKYHREIHIVLLDILMPEMDGVETFYKLRNINPDLPIIFISGFSATKEVKKALLQGNALFIDKPFRRSELIQAIYQLLHSENVQ